MSNDYHWVREWGKLLDSNEAYIEAQVEKARKENAPENAVYKSNDGHWVTTDDVTSGTTREALGLDINTEATNQ